jgi:hypothetical protein
MSSLFYRSITEEFLNAGANCVLGPQIDLPAVFAAEWAHQFFEEFFKGKRKIGIIIRDLTRVFCDQGRNPLGLIYSLYCGLDTHLEESVSEKKDAKNPG